MTEIESTRPDAKRKPHARFKALEHEERSLGLARIDATDKVLDLQQQVLLADQVHMVHERQ